MNAAWQTVLISASVAAIVSVLVDLAIRPWLELRKDRVVRRDRERGAFKSSLLDYIGQLEWAVSVAKSPTLGGLSSTIKDLGTKTISIGYQVKHATWLPRPVQELLEYSLGGTTAKFHSAAIAIDVGSKPASASEEVVEKVSQALPEVPKDMVRLTLNGIAKATRIEVSEEISIDLLVKLDFLPGLRVATRYLQTPWWQVIRRQKLRREASRILAGYRERSPANQTVVQQRSTPTDAAPSRQSEAKQAD